MIPIDKLIIRSPGKFEGEARYVPHYWEIYLEGFADSDDGKVLRFKITKEDRELFPELKKRRMVSLVEDDQGFVCEV